MQKYLINKKSDHLIIFFTGWGCDETEFAHLKANSDVLILYNYTDLNLNFDFSKYKKIDLIAFSAGVFAASVVKFDFKINKKIAISGNPYLFDEKFGIPQNIQEILCNITVENADDFAKNYLVKTDYEWAKFHHSQRTIESCRIEFDNLKNLYKNNKPYIKDIFDIALFGGNDQIFDLSAQKEFYGNRLRIVQNARHSLFFRIDNYKEFLTSEI